MIERDAGTIDAMPRRVTLRPLCRGRYEKGEFERGVAIRNCEWHKLYNHFLLLKIVLEKEGINIY